MRYMLKVLAWEEGEESSSILRVTPPAVTGHSAFQTTHFTWALLCLFKYTAMNSKPW